MKIFVMVKLHNSEIMSNSSLQWCKKKEVEQDMRNDQCQCVFALSLWGILIQVSLGKLRRRARK